MLAASICFLVGCSIATGITNYCRSACRFQSYRAEQRVQYQAGAEAFARRVTEELTPAVRTVEDAQLGRFAQPIRVYVCATQESFGKMTGTAAKGVAYRGSIFLSPRLMVHPEEISSYLTHELSHLFIQQHVGWYKALTIPSWFKEGLAVFVSKGGGAGDVTEKEAVASILSGRALEPKDSSDMLAFLFPAYGSRGSLEVHMFNRQASLFISFLKEYDARAFENLLVRVQGGQGFKRSFRQVYHMSASGMWRLFADRCQRALIVRAGFEKRQGHS